MQVWSCLREAHWRSVQLLTGLKAIYQAAALQSEPTTAARGLRVALMTRRPCRGAHLRSEAGLGLDHDNMVTSGPPYRDGGASSMHPSGAMGPGAGCRLHALQVACDCRHGVTRTME